MRASSTSSRPGIGVQKPPATVSASAACIVPTTFSRLGSDPPLAPGQGEHELGMDRAAVERLAAEGAVFCAPAAG